MMFYILPWMHRGAFERAIASVENAKYGVAFASGLAATAAIMATLNSGDHIICIDDVYGGTQRYFRKVLLYFLFYFTC